MNTNQSTADLNVTVVSRIIDYMERVVASAIDPQEVLEHVMNTERAGAEQRMADQKRILADLDRENAVARATPCDIEGCDGSSHEGTGPASEWVHALSDETFDDNIILVGTSKWTGEPFTSDILFEGSGRMTADEFRAAADLYESFPAWLRSRADRLDLLNGAPVDKEPEGREAARNLIAAADAFDALETNQ